MTTTKDELLRSYQKKLSSDNFFTGRLYPILVAIIVLLGYFTKQEVFLNVVTAILTFWGLCTSKTVRPLICYLFTVLYQIPVEHQVQNNATDPDSILAGWRAYVVLGSFGLVILGTFIFLIKQNKRHRVAKRDGSFKWKPLPLFVPTLLFCLSLFLSGYGTEIKKPLESMVFTVGQAVVYLILFAIFYRGLEDEDSGELLRYFAYVTLIVACILNVEVGYYHFTKLKETGALEFIRNDSEIRLGFGDSNLVAFNVGLLIPMQLYGFTKCKGRLIYLLSALLTFVMCVSCVSRTATIAAFMVLVLGLILAFFARSIKTSRRVTNRLLILLVVCAAIVAMILVPETVTSLFADLDRTFNGHTESNMQSKIGQMLSSLLGDINLSGRVSIWDKCALAFEESPIFGRGIYFLEIPGSFEISYMPWLAHNTVMYLLGAGGIVAFAAYLLYRLATALVFFVRPSTDKWFLFLVCLFLVVSGLTDNYAFYFYTVFHYVLALAIACKLNREAKAERRAQRERIAQRLAKGEPKA